MSGEIITGTGVAVALGSKLLYDVCGPTAKYLGREFLSNTEVGVNNLKRVFEHAAKRLADLKKSDGQVPPRVLKGILSEGYFCEDELQAAYLGGVLASSKSSVARDDRAITHCALISSLSSYQLRTHCILYSSILRATRPNILELLQWLDKPGITVLIQESDYHSAMDFSATEQPTVISEHAFIGLETRALSYGGSKPVNPSLDKVNSVTFRYFYPTRFGIELFLWGLGVGDRGLEAYRPELLQLLDVPFKVVPIKMEFGRVFFS